MTLKLYNKYQPWMSSFSHYSIILLILALISSFLTYGQITQSQISNVHNPKVTIILIMIDLVLFLVLSILVTRKIFRLWHKGKHQSGRLQNKIILMFCLVAAIPTIIVTVFSTIFFNFGIQSWFDQRVSTAINESVVVAESYFKVQIKLIESDAKIMAQELNYVSSDITYGPERFANYLTKQAEDKTLVEASIFQVKPDNLLAESRYNFTIPFHNLPKNGIEEAINDKIVLIKPDDDNKLRALIKLDFLPNSYLLIGRTIDNKVLDHMANTKGAASEYERLRGQISNLQIQFLIIFIVVSLLLLFTAIWLGLTLSSTLIKPLNRLVSATTQITKGNFSVILDVKNKNDEISVLANAFNAMTSELGSQRTKLIKANHEIQAKHHFNETVLSGVSTGIVALDMNLQISMINPTALNILSLETEADLTHQDFNILCPEISILLPHAQDFVGHEVQKEIVINRGNRTSILVVRIITEKFLGKTEGYIITFDDITALVLAQRSAAWSDVARKIAHEIKNPLTPIHLATERLRKKYSQEVSDTQNFEKYLEIIGKHVKDIGTIVEEFVQFARMPAPEFAHNNLVQIVREAIFSRKCLDKDINYITEFQVDTAIINCDPRQISQVLLNLLKNAEEAIEHCHNINRGEIKVLLLVQDEMVELEVMDNGGGFSSELFDHLTEPYVTNKSTGTGLGLAIVKKVLDDHKTAISFTNNNSPGATIKLTFNLVK